MVKEKTECPVCGISVKAENLQNHVGKVHPGQDVDLPEVKKKKAKRADAYLERKWPKWAAIVVVIVVLLIVVVVLLPPEEEEPGTPAPDFTVVDVDDNVFQLNAHIGPSPILIEFINPLGSRCKTMAGVLNNLTLHYGVSLEILALSKQTESQLIQFRDTYGNDWTFASVGSEIFTDYGVSGLPHFVLVDKKGFIRYEASGIVTLDELISEIDPCL
jgi:peroxiredoxin